MTDYQEKLRDPRWQKKRDEIWRRDNFTCQSCGCTSRTLHVHHLKYLPMKEPWDYPNWLMVTYCNVCHETEHLIGEVNREIFYELIDANDLYIKPIAQTCILIEKYPAFYPRFKSFLNEMMIEYLRQREAESVK